jgi:alcohol dehydrogenase
MQAERVLLVTDPGVRDSGLCEPVVASLREAGLASEIFDQVQGNPRDVHCLAGAERCRAFGADLLVGVGGGSAIDTAKCIALLLTNGGHPRDWEGFGALQSAPLPVIAVATTAGTGSEASPSAIVTDTTRRKKMNLFDPRICPAVALVDPDLTLSMPAHLTASTGSDIEARCGMAHASLTAGLAVGVTDVSGCHCLAESIGAVYDHPHGVCCAVTMPLIMDYNLPVSIERYARLVDAFGLDVREGPADAAARQAISYVRGLNEELGIPPLSELIDGKDLDLLAEKAAANTSAPSNPRPAQTSDFRAMFESGLTGTVTDGGGASLAATQARNPAC